MEPLVRIPRLVPRQPLGTGDGGPPSGRRCDRPHPVRVQPVPGRAPYRRPNGRIPVLAHGHGRRSKRPAAGGVETRSGHTASGSSGGGHRETRVGGRSGQRCGRTVAKRRTSAICRRTVRTSSSVVRAAASSTSVSASSCVHVCAVTSMTQSVPIAFPPRSGPARRRRPRRRACRRDHRPAGAGARARPR